MAARLSMTQLSPQQQASLTNRYGSLKNLGYIPGQGLMNLTKAPTITDITTGEIVGHPREGLTGYLGMAADLLGIDTSSINYGTDIEAERAADRGQRQYAAEDPLRYMTAGEVTPSMIEGIVATDYSNRGYYHPKYINYAAKGGRVGRMGGGMMIIDDNDVVNNGMGAILNKYKQIRSEL